jgi:hypothetical protein
MTAAANGPLYERLALLQAGRRWAGKLTMTPEGSTVMVFLIHGSRVLQNFPRMLDTNRRDNWCPQGVLLWLVGDRGVPLPSRIGNGLKFENGLAPHPGEAWGGPTRESVLLQMLANLPETACCFSAPLSRCTGFSTNAGYKSAGQLVPSGRSPLAGRRSRCASKLATAANLKTGWPCASERLGVGRRGRAYCSSCLQILLAIC